MGGSTAAVRWSKLPRRLKNHGHSQYRGGHLGIGADTREELDVGQVAERDRGVSNFATGDADELPGSKEQAAGPRKSWHEWCKELMVNLARGESDSDEGPTPEEI